MADLQYIRNYFEVCVDLFHCQFMTVDLYGTPMPPPILQKKSVSGVGIVMRYGYIALKCYII